MRRSFSGSTLVLLIMAATLVVAACMQAGVLMRSEDAERLARSIEHSRELDSQIVARMAGQALDQTVERSCQSAGVKANLSILLKHLSTMSPSEAPEIRSATLQGTRDYIDRSLACLPTSGNLWLRRAMIGLALNDQFSVIRNDLLISQRYSPAEMDVLFGRYRVWNMLPKLQLAAAASLVLADMEAICNQAPLLWRLTEPTLTFKTFLQERSSRATNCLVRGERGRRERPMSGTLPGHAL